MIISKSNQSQKWKNFFYNTEEQIPIKENVFRPFFSVKIQSKISENKFYPNTYDIDYADQKGSGNISAEFINEKWKISKNQSILVFKHQEK